MHSIRDHLEYAVARLLLTGLRVAPLSLANVIARACTRWLDRFLPRLRRTALQNLTFAFPRLSAAEHSAIVDGVFRSVARVVVALARFPDINPQNVHQWIDYQGLENYQAAKQKGKGILVATAHFGNWELSAFAHALMTEPMSVMVRPLDNALTDRLVEKRRASSGNILIQKRDAARPVLKTLKANGAVGILIDQNTTPAEGVFVDFFGKQACASSAFTKLAYRSGAAVIPGYALWDFATQKYQLIFEPEVPMTGDLQADTQAIHTALERAIRQHPGQWLWIHRRWKTRPPGEPPLY